MRSVCIAKKFGPSPTSRSHLVQNFAAQAVIAIENARLLNELVSAQSTWSSRRLPQKCFRLSAARPGELEPVFTTMLEKAVRICDAKFGSLYLHEDGKLRLVAAHDAHRNFLRHVEASPFEPAPGRAAR